MPEVAVIAWGIATIWSAAIFVSLLIYGFRHNSLYSYVTDAERKLSARILLAALLFGWAAPVWLLGWAVRKLWRESELPSPKTLLLRSGEADPAAGQLSITKRD